jgi:hypothetical protein
LVENPRDFLARLKRRRALRCMDAEQTHSPAMIPELSRARSMPLSTAVALLHDIVLATRSTSRVSRT